MNPFLSPEFAMNLRFNLLPFVLVSLTACASYRSTQVRVMSDQGGGIANAQVLLNGGHAWRTDGAGRAIVKYQEGNAHDYWHVTAEGFRPLSVDASPEVIRIRQYGSRATNHDAEPLVFTLEQNPPNAASNPKQFESGEGRKAFESTVDQPKTDEKQDPERKPAKFNA